jgi:hypothetical protein
MTDSIDHDALFKNLLRTFFFEFLELFLPDVAAYVDRDSITFLDKEIFTDVTGKDKHIADLVARARFRDHDTFFLLHTEPMARPEADFPRRMFQYFARLFEEYALPVYPIVLFSYDAPMRLEPDRFEVTFPNKTVLSFSYDVIQLNRLDWRDFLDYANPVASALMAKMRIASEDRPAVKAECLRLLTSLDLDAARMQLISSFVDSYLRLNAAEANTFRQAVETFSPPQKERSMRLMTSWKLEGIEEGKVAEAQKLGIKLLRRRVGELSEMQESRIRRLSLDRLEDLADALLDFKHSRDLDAWLNAVPESELVEHRQD